MIALVALATVAAVAAPTALPPAGLTPVSERVAVIAALNKRNGQTQIFSVKPGSSVAFGPLTIVLKTCETAPPWEAKQTAAFLQIDEAEVRPRIGGGSVSSPRRIFSGWMFAESPSLNPLAHPLYDVWVKSCTMRFPGDLPSEAPKPSKAPKSPAPETAAAN